MRRAEGCQTDSAMESVVRPPSATLASLSEAPPPLAQRGAGPTRVGRGSERPTRPEAVEEDAETGKRPGG